MGRARADGQGLPRSHRIRRGSDIRALLREGTRSRSRVLDVFSAPAPGESSRFGTIVPRHGRKVVDRNLLRRRLRELGRTEVLPTLRERGCALDVLVRTRPDAYGLPFSELRAELLRLTERLCSDASSSG